MSEYFSIRWEDGVVRMLDQRLLPDEIVYRDYTRCEDVATAIRDMVIRGAPAIGVAAGYGLALTARHSKAIRAREFIEELRASAEDLNKSRPTAVNLFAAVHRIMHVIDESVEGELDPLRNMVINEAQKIAGEDVQMNMRLAQLGQKLIPDPANLIHHCNTGALATAGIGTALGVIRVAHESGKKIHVYVDETRPRLQGARLTSWELKQLGIPHTVIVDGASGFIMHTNQIDACLVGCDRIASNGDVANKIGTYNLALAAYAHGIPFYSVGPTTTIDLSINNGEEIAIEHRPDEEISTINGQKIIPEGISVENPAFDVTPAKYVTAIVTDKGIVYPPYNQTLPNLMGG